jgi:hypothetical protein
LQNQEKPTEKETGTPKNARQKTIQKNASKIKEVYTLYTSGVSTKEIGQKMKKASFISS